MQRRWRQRWLEANLRSDAFHPVREPWRDADPTAPGGPLVNRFVYRPVENMTDAKARGNAHDDGKRGRETFEITFWLASFPPVNRGGNSGANNRPDGGAVSSRVDDIDPSDRTVNEHSFPRTGDQSLQNHAQIQRSIQWQQCFP